MAFLRQPLGPLLNETIDSLSSYAQQHNVVLQCSGGCPAVQVNVDGQRLIQALSNLLSNAIKLSPQGEAITIKVQQQDTNIHILVRDRGQGVASEFEDRLFQRFAQADSSSKRGNNEQSSSESRVGFVYHYKQNRADNQHYFPIQNEEKMRPRRSSELNSPVISFKCC